MYIHISYHHIGSMCVSSTCLFHIIHSLYSSWRKKAKALDDVIHSDDHLGRLRDSQCSPWSNELDPFQVSS